MVFTGWVCVHCETVNAGSANHCEVCDAERSEATPAAVVPPPEVHTRTPTVHTRIWPIVAAAVALILIVLWFSSGSHEDTQANFSPPPQTSNTQPPSTESSSRQGAASTPDAPSVGRKGNGGDGANRDAVVIQALDGEWKFSREGRDSLLKLKNGAGEFVSDALYELEQEVKATTSDGLMGVLLKGQNPVLKGTGIRLSSYSPDELLIQRKQDGGFSAWDRDNVNVKEWEGLTVTSFTQDPNAEGNSDDLTARQIQGVWQFANFTARRYLASLVFRNGHGTFSTQVTVVVTQRASVETTLEGYLVRCLAPRMRDGIPAPLFSPDLLLFQRQPGGAFKVWIKDDVNIKDWSPLDIVSRS